MQFRSNLAVLYALVATAGAITQVWPAVLCALVGIGMLIPRMRDDQEVWNSWTAAQSGLSDVGRQRELFLDLIQKKHPDAVVRFDADAGIGPR